MLDPQRTVFRLCLYLLCVSHFLCLCSLLSPFYCLSPSLFVFLDKQGKQIARTGTEENGKQTGVEIEKISVREIERSRGEVGRNLEIESDP